MPRRPTIHELERILDAEEDTPIEILPNGEVRARGTGAAELGGKKPLTMREDLGGEYLPPHGRLSQERHPVPDDDARLAEPFDRPTPISLFIYDPTQPFRTENARLQRMLSRLKRRLSRLTAKDTRARERIRELEDTLAGRPDASTVGQRMRGDVVWRPK